MNLGGLFELVHRVVIPGAEQMKQFMADRYRLFVGVHHEKLAESIAGLGLRKGPTADGHEKEDRHALIIGCSFVIVGDGLHARRIGDNGFCPL